MLIMLYHIHQCHPGKIRLIVRFSSVVIQIGETAAFKRTNLAIPRLQFLVYASDMEL